MLSLYPEQHNVRPDSIGLYAFTDDTVTVTIHCVFLIVGIMLNEHGIHTVVNEFNIRMRIKAVNTSNCNQYAVHTRYYTRYLLKSWVANLLLQMGH